MAPAGQFRCASASKTPQNHDEGPSGHFVEASGGDDPVGSELMRRIEGMTLPAQWRRPWRRLGIAAVALAVAINALAVACPCAGERQARRPDRRRQHGPRHLPELCRRPALSRVAGQADDALHCLRADRAGPPLLSHQDSFLGQCSCSSALKARRRGRHRDQPSRRHQGSDYQVMQRRRCGPSRAYCRQRDPLRADDDTEGPPARHAGDHLPQCLRPARSRAGHDRTGHDHAGTAGCRTISRSTTRCLPPAPSPTTAIPIATTTPCCSATRAATV